ncbi:hypothetical protein BCON_0083g00020 [Botryotinia convoluta]|uniref:Uncharacterized protein n=1 Tax=Botryotinia convoluta TaxID=54673 RepID=A0A4Z1IAU2_9HELO|nr:hypothetical protein BCON_0083g00020 [Botryotinia convoluta]
MERTYLESPFGQSVFVPRLNPNDTFYINSRLQQNPFESSKNLIELCTRRTIRPQDGPQELKSIVEQYEIPRAPPEGMPMVSYPKPLQECMEESQKRFDEAIKGQKRKFSAIKRGGDFECRKKIKSSANETSLDEIELEEMQNKCTTDDYVHIFENDPQPRILNHQLSTFSSRFIENTQTPCEFSIEFESVMTTRKSSPRLTIYDDPSHQQSDFNGTKDISSHESEQALRPYAAAKDIKRLDI